MLTPMLQALSAIEDIIDNRADLTNKLLNHEINIKEYKAQSIALDNKLKEIRDSKVFNNS